MNHRLSTNCYVVVDVETTGVDPARDKVCEAAAIRFEDGRIVDRFVTLVNPGMPIPPEASEVHHLTDQDVEGAPPLEAISASLRAFVGDSLVVAHSAQFDRSFLPMLSDRRWLCTLRAAGHAYPRAAHLRNQYLRYWLKIRHPELNGVSAHRAAGDALVTGLVLHGILVRHEGLHPGDDFAAFEAFVASPIPVEVFRYGGKHRGAALSELARTDPGYLRWVLQDAEKPESLRKFKRAIDPDTLASIRRHLDSVGKLANSSFYNGGSRSFTSSISPDGDREAAIRKGGA